MKSDGENVQASLGLPSERLGNIRLLYCAQSEMLVLSATIQRLGFTQSMLFVRHVQKYGYQSINGLSAEWQQSRSSAMRQETTLSLRCPVILDGTVFFVIDEVNSSGPQGRVAGNEIGVGSVGLRAMTFDVWDTRERNQGDCTITSLIGVDSASACLFAVAAFAVVGEGHSGYRVHYNIARLLPKQRSVEIVSALEHVFY